MRKFSLSHSHTFSFFISPNLYPPLSIYLSFYLYLSLSLSFSISISLSTS